MDYPTVKYLKSLIKDFDYSDEGSTYPFFLQYFEGLTTLKPENIAVGISFTYAWMPTILKTQKFTTENLEQCAEILNKVKRGTKALSNGELAFLVSIFNNSEVGTSKLLHFIAPTIFPIWDSRVKVHFPKKCTYERYKEWCDEMVQQLEFDEVYSQTLSEYSPKPDYSPSKIRILELLLFCNGRKQLKEKRENARREGVAVRESH